MALMSQSFRHFITLMRKKIHPPEILSISNIHRLLNLKKPTNPLVCVIDLADIDIDTVEMERSLTYNFYNITLKKNCEGFRYGQQYYDFVEGVMSFVAPNQVLQIEERGHTKMEGYMLLIHPDFFKGNPIQTAIKSYGFFSYATNEALHLSAGEEESIVGILKSIDQEIKTNIDQFSQNLIISYIDLLLKYSERFYSRQFITRKNVTNDILLKLEQVLESCLAEDNLSRQGMPTVKQVAKALNMSPNYLSDLLHSSTGLSTRQHIHNHVLEKSKELLSTTSLSVNEIAFKLGFEYPQSFHRLFKSKTNQSPLEYKESFNTH